MFSIILFLTSAYQQNHIALYRHYLADIVSAKNFQYQGTSYAEPQVVIHQTEKQMNDSGSKVIQKLNSLNGNSSVGQIREVIKMAYNARERSLGRDQTSQITEIFEKFFNEHPSKIKNLSRQDICALIVIDTDFTIYANSAACFKNLIEGFKLLVKKDFDSLDISIAFLKLSHAGFMPINNWNIERQDWALATVNKINPNGALSTGIRAYRQAAQAIRQRKPALLDQAIQLFESAKLRVGTKADKDIIDGHIKYLKRQKELLLDLMKKEKKKG